MAESSLPRFRGRRRENERHFEETTTFSEFIDNVDAHIASQKLTTDEEKINFLLVCSDKKNGDFYSKCREYKNHSQYSGLSYEDIVSHLRAIYATEREKTIFEANREIINEGTKTLNSRNLLSSRLNAFHTAQENSIKFYLETDTITFPERNAGESNEDFNARRNKYKAELIRDYNLKLFFGTKFTPSVSNQIFNPNEMRNRSYKDTVLKLYEVLRETPITTSVFIEEVNKKISCQ